MLQNKNEKLNELILLVEGEKHKILDCLIGLRHELHFSSQSLLDGNRLLDIKRLLKSMRANFIRQEFKHKELVLGLQERISQ